MADIRRAITAWRLAVWVWLDCRARHVARAEARAPLVPTWRRATTDGTAAVMRQGVLGCRPDRSRSPSDHDWQGSAEDRLPWDAAALQAWAEGSVQDEAVRWLVRCAERGAPPQWDVGPLRCLPVLTKTGRIEVVFETVRWGRRPTALTAAQHCPVQYSGTVEDAVYARDLYCMLLDGLALLADAAPGLGLVAHRVDGIGLPTQPWAREKAA